MPRIFVEVVRGHNGRSDGVRRNTGRGAAACGAAVLCTMLGLACPASPVVPAAALVPASGATGGADGLQLLDLHGAAAPRELLLGGGWQGASWVGCSSWLALDRTVDHERRFSVLDVDSGQLLATGLPAISDLALRPDVVEALVAAFGEEAAFPEDRLAYGMLRGDAAGRPEVEIVASGEEEQPDVVVSAELLPLPGPVERAFEAEGPCTAGHPLRWAMRSPHALQVLPGESAAWACERVGGEATEGEEGEEGAAGSSPPRRGGGEGTRTEGTTPGGGGTVGTSGGQGDQPLVLELPDGGTVMLPGSAPVDGYERCRSPDGAWQAVRVEQPGLYGYDVLYVVRNADGAVETAARYDVSALVVAGVAVVDAATLLYGGPDGWFVIRGGDDPERIGDFPPAVR